MTHVILDEIYNDNIDNVIYLCIKYPKILGVRYNDMNLLVYASMCGSISCLKYLSKYFNVNLDTSNNYSPLMYASKYMHIDCMKYLIENGADVTYIDDAGCNILMRLITTQHSLKKYNCYNNKYNSKKYTLLNCVKYLIPYSDIKYVSPNTGYNVLIWSMFCKMHECTELLIPHSENIAI